MPTSPITDLTMLAARAGSGTDSDPALESLIWMALNGTPNDDFVEIDDGIWARRDPDDGAAFDISPRFLSSVDEALTLLERHLPGWSRMVRHNPIWTPATHLATIASPDRLMTADGRANGEARAIIAALLHGLAERQRAAPKIPPRIYPG